MRPTRRSPHTPITPDIYRVLNNKPGLTRLAVRARVRGKTQYVLNILRYEIAAGRLVDIGGKLYPMRKGTQMGRPPRAKVAATEQVKIRLTPDEARAWESASKAAGASTVGEWVRNLVNAAALPQKKS